MLQDLVPENLIKGTFWENSVFSNSYADYLVFVLLFIIATIIVKLIRISLIAISQKIADKSQSELAGLLIAKIKKLLVPLEYFGVFYFSVKSLVLHPYFIKTLDITGLLIVVFYVVRFTISIIDFFLQKKMIGANPGRVQVLRSIIPAINISIWGLGVVFILSNLGFDISALVAGLGIGGIAVALAAQSLLGDVFSYLSILADKPFEIGDVLNVDGIIGRVTYIGIKTTRLTSVTGEQLVFSNSDLTSSRIRNFQDFPARRGDIMIGVTYETPSHILEEIPKIIRNIIETTPDARIDRSHFHSYGDFSLNFQTVFWVDNSDFVLFMDRQQSILLRIFKEFEAMGIDFAYPTQTLYVSKKDNNEK